MSQLTNFLEGLTRKLNLACPMAVPSVSCQSVSPNKSLQALGGDIQQLFDIQNNKNNNFIDQLQQQQQLEPIHSTFLPGDKPINFF